MKTVGLYIYKYMKRLSFTALFVISLFCAALSFSSSTVRAQVPPWCCGPCPYGGCNCPSWPSYVAAVCQTNCEDCRDYIDDDLRNDVEDEVDDQHDDTRDFVSDQHDDGCTPSNSYNSSCTGSTRPQITRRHIDLRNFLGDEQTSNDPADPTDMLWEHILPALADMTAQIDTILLARTHAVGTFFDAQNQIQSQNKLSELKALAQKDYSPDGNLCKFGTQSRSLAASEELAKYNSVLLGIPSFSRHVTKTNNVEFDVLDEPLISRKRQFETIYCNPHDNNERLGDWCAASSQAERYNKDLNFSAGVDNSSNLNLNFSDGALSADEEDILALTSNLYGYGPSLKANSYALNFKENAPQIANVRSLMAKRNVAKNSFNIIAGLKASGPEVLNNQDGDDSNDDYIAHLLDYMGVLDTTADPHYKNYSSGKPSYDAQMELLTKTIYQSPSFMNSLITEPANVKRQRAAMQSVELMQQRDIFETVQRSEMLMSLLVELKLRDQHKLNDLKLRKLGEQGRKALP